MFELIVFTIMMMATCDCPMIIIVLMNGMGVLCIVIVMTVPFKEIYVLSLLQVTQRTYSTSVSVITSKFLEMVSVSEFLWLQWRKCEIIMCGLISIYSVNALKSSLLLNSVDQLDLSYTMVHMHVSPVPCIEVRVGRRRERKSFSKKRIHVAEITCFL